MIYEKISEEKSIKQKHQYLVIQHVALLKNFVKNCAKIAIIDEFSIHDISRREFVHQALSDRVYNFTKYINNELILNHDIFQCSYFAHFSAVSIEIKTIFFKQQQSLTNLLCIAPLLGLVTSCGHINKHLKLNK